MPAVTSEHACSSSYLQHGGYYLRCVTPSWRRHCSLAATAQAETIELDLMAHLACHASQRPANATAYGALVNILHYISCLYLQLN